VVRYLAIAQAITRSDDVWEGCLDYAETCEV